ncbi:MAG: Lrp/AsnC family transcriptional regulator [Acidimicrobiales bacterium]
MDQTDRRLVELLVADGRRSVNDLAEELHVSRATAYQRLSRLRESGVIRGFTAVVDHRALGLAISALVLIRVEQHAWPQLEGKLLALPGAEWLAAAAGEFDFALLVRVRDVDTLRDVVLKGIQSLAAVRSSETVLLLEDRRAGA